MTFSLRLVLIAMMISLATPAMADDDRMAGKKPPVSQKAPAEVKEEKDSAPAAKAKDVKDTKKEKTEEKDKTAPKDEVKKPDARANANNQPAPETGKAPVVNTPKPHTGMSMDRKQMESLGPLTNPLKGGLGNDMWAGTARSVVQEFLPQLPAGNTIWPAQLLARRVLLSNGDVSMMRADKAPDPGQDLFTLRLEKLVEMGAYEDAVSLYTMMEGEPSHDRLARVGIMALVHAGLPAQACLEVRAAHRDVSAQPDADAFWPRMEALCTYIQMDSVQKISDPQFAKITLNVFAQSSVTGIPGSKILTMLTSRPNYRFAVSSPSDLDSLTDLERAVLKGLGRIDYGHFRIKKLRDIRSPVLMSMATDPNMPTDMRITLMIEAASRGLIDPEQLGALYLKVAKESGDETGLPGRFAAISKDGATTEEKNAVLADLLSRQDGVSLPSSLLPFAPFTADINPTGLSPNAVKSGLLLMLQGGITPPEKWVSTWLASESGDSRKSRDSVLLYMANMLSENLPTNSITFSDQDLKTLFTPPESWEALDIWAVFSGLGDEIVLHNVASQEFYEKHLDLTLVNDYVMPSGSLVEKLREAARNDRLGETALLASVALNGNLEKIHPGIVQDVLKCLETVGLKEEAVNMALGVVLSLKQ